MVKLKLCAIVLLFISCTIFATTKYVNPASAGGDGSTSGLSGATAAYTHMANLIAAWNAATVTDPWIVYAKGSTADSTTWGTIGAPTGSSTTNSLTIMQDPANPTGGVYNTNCYRVEFGSNLIIITSTAPKLILNGIQFKITRNASSGNRIYACNSGMSIIKGCIFQEVCSGGAVHEGGLSISSTTNSLVYNNIFYNFTAADSLYSVIDVDGHDTVCNNLFYNCAWGIRADGYHKSYIANNIVFNCTRNFNDIASAGNVFDYNASDSAYGTNAQNLGNNAAFQWDSLVKDRTATPPDFHIRSTNSLAYNTGTNLKTVLSDSVDITGAVRGDAWDIGPFYYNSGCTPATITRHATIIDTVGNVAKRYGHITANAFDSVNFATTTLDSVAMLAKTTKDTIVYKAKKKAAVTVLVDTIYSCAGVNKNVCFDSLIFTGWAGTYTSPFACTANVQTILSPTNTTYADSFSFVDLPVWATGNKTTGAITCTPTAVASKVGVKIIAWYKQTKQDSAYDTISVIYGLVKLDSIRTNAVKDSGKWHDTINVYGRGYGATQGSSTLAFGDSTPTAFSWANTLIRFPLQNMDTGWYNFQVVNGTDTAKLTNAFKVLKTLSQFTVTMTNAAHAGTITPASGTAIDSGAMTKLTFTPPAGYRLSGWTASGGAHLNAIQDSFYLSANGTLTALDSIIHYTLTNANDGHGTFTPATGLQDSANNFSIVATSSAGYRFWKWTRSGINVYITDSTQTTTPAYLKANGTITLNDSIIHMADSVISVYPHSTRIDSLSTTVQRTVTIKVHGPNHCTANTVVWFGPISLGQNVSYTDSTVTDTLFKYPTMPNGYYRVFMVDPSWTPTISDTLLNACKLNNPSIIVTNP